ncbi:MAG: capsule biosynthesis GfcC family protein [Vibrionaceae bacterium]
MKNNTFTSWLKYRPLRRILAASCLFLFTMEPALAAFSMQVWSSNNTPLIAPLFFSKSAQLQTIVEQAIGQITPKEGSAKIASKPHTSDAVFWAGARLFQHQNQTALLDNVLQKINVLKQEKAKHAPLIQSLNALQIFLEQSTFYAPLVNDIDLDNLRLGVIADPKIEQDAILILPMRAPFVWVVGALPRPIQLVHKSQASARDYVVHASPLTLLGIDTVVVIAPNGVTSDYPIAYWNNDNAAVAPGSIIYVPYKNLPKNMKDLNAEIVQLLQSRVI